MSLGTLPTAISRGFTRSKERLRFFRVPTLWQFTRLSFPLRSHGCITGESPHLPICRDTVRRRFFFLADLLRLDPQWAPPKRTNCVQCGIPFTLTPESKGFFVHEFKVIFFYCVDCGANIFPKFLPPPKNLKHRVSHTERLIANIKGDFTK